MAYVVVDETDDVVFGEMSLAVENRSFSFGSCFFSLHCLLLSTWQDVVRYCLACYDRAERYNVLQSNASSLCSAVQATVLEISVKNVLEQLVESKPESFEESSSRVCDIFRQHKVGLSLTLFMFLFLVWVCR